MKVQFMKKLIVRGYYGRDNLGDELMKELFIKFFHCPDINLMIMNSAPAELLDIYGIVTPDELVTGGLPSAKNAIKRFFTILAADVYVYGGGTMITDKHSSYHLLENAVYFFFRKLLRKKSLLISAGATKFKTRRGLFLARRLIGFSSKAYIRDDLSFQYLDKVTHHSKKLVPSADMVLLAKDMYPIAERRQKTIGLSLMPYYYATYHQRGLDQEIRCELVKQIRTISEQKKDYRFVLIPIQAGQNNRTDYEFCEQIYLELRNEINIGIIAETDSTAKIRALQKCEYLISMRLHVLMIAKLSGVKVCAINHNEKIQAFMQRYDSPKNVVGLEDLRKLAECFLHLNRPTKTVH
jgi:polysaccharide pyruvyl transferase WcaK-like protein